MDWETVNVLINTADNPDNGQILAIQQSQRVGTPFSIVKRLVEYLNQRSPDLPWLITPMPLIVETDFWSVVAENRGKITELDLTFVAPNILRGRDATSEGMRLLKERAGVQIAEVKLKNADGQLTPDTPEIRGSMEVISEGGGSVKLVTGGKTVYSSEDATKAVSVDDEMDKPLTKENLGILKEIIAWIFRR